MVTAENMLTRQFSAQRKNEMGFTLIELLVVILIIGILAAIAVPMFLNQRKIAADASVKSDIRNMATSYKTWRVDPDHTNDAFRTAVGGMSISSLPSGMSRENTGIPETRASEGNSVELVVVANTNTIWSRPHEEGEFCLAGKGMGGNYDYPGGNIAWYDRVLYYDSALGGLKTMEELSDAINSGQTISCYGYAERWKTATGH